MKIFIDVDNTIIEHSGFYSYETEGRIHRSIGKYPYDNQEAIKAMYETSICHDPELFRKVIKNDNVYILTKYPHPQYDFYKQIRIAQILGISQAELLEWKNSCGKPKYICVPETESKVDKVKEIFKVNTMEEWILIDDYSQNLIEWEENGGIAIKYYNEYNSPSHPTNGIAISNFRIFEYYLGMKTINAIYTKGTSRYKINLIEENLTKGLENRQFVDQVKIVKDDLESHLKIDNFPENHKYSYFNFLLEYYNFRNHLDSSYWTHELEKRLENEMFTSISSLFEMPMGEIEKLERTLNKNILKINVLSMKAQEKPNNIYDVYITVSDKYYVDHATDLFERVTTILNKLLIPHEYHNIKC